MGGGMPNLLHVHVPDPVYPGEVGLVQRRNFAAMPSQYSIERVSNSVGLFLHSVGLVVSRAGGLSEKTSLIKKSPRRIRMKRSTLALLAAIGLAAAPQAYAKDIQALLNEGPGDTAMGCTQCHGPNGEGDIPQFANSDWSGSGAPRLAGQLKSYIAKQLNDFKSAKRDPDGNSPMQGVAQAMSEEEINAMADYFSAQSIPVEPKDLADQGDIDAYSRGMTLMLYGDPEAGIPACQSCHGEFGRGVAPQFPRLTGQTSGYVMNQLAGFRMAGNGGSSDEAFADAWPRQNDPVVAGNGYMREFSVNLEDSDIRALGLFFERTKLRTQY